MQHIARRLATAVGLAAAALVTAQALGATVASAEPATGTIRDSGVGQAVKDNYIVVLKGGAAGSGKATAAANDLTARYGGQVRRAYGAALSGFTVQMTEAAAKRLAANPLVESVEQDRQVAMLGTQTNPPSWGLDRIDQRDLPLNASYGYSTTASNVTAYIIDTGIRFSHSEFGGRATSGIDTIDNDSDASDCNGHGTHVAGTVGGSTYGVAKGVKLVGVRVLNCQGTGSWSQIIAGVDWVTAHAVKPAVANMSIGGSASSTLDQAVRNSINAGITYAVAAGNDNVDACTTSPARTAEAITVGATDSKDARASFSNFGSCVDIFAPGVSIKSSAFGGDTATTTMSGTSMATPHVAGTAALVLAENPTATPKQVRDALVAGATANKVTSAGTGSPNALLYSAARVAAAPAPAPAPVTCATVTNGTDVAVPDLSTATSSITVANCARNASATTKVEVHVKHTWRGDLVIDLLAPDGTAYRLKSSSSGDSAADVNATYTVNASAKAANGTWKLRVQDAFRGDTGYIDSWSLTV